jgi:hypothetical protein
VLRWRKFPFRACFDPVLVNIGIYLLTSAVPLCPQVVS